MPAMLAQNRLAAFIEDIYVRDITIGEGPQLRGHWTNRLPAIERDIRMLEEMLTVAAWGSDDPRMQHERDGLPARIGRLAIGHC